MLVDGVCVVNTLFRASSLDASLWGRSIAAWAEFGCLLESARSSLLQNTSASTQATSSPTVSERRILHNRDQPVLPVCGGGFPGSPK